MTHASADNPGAVSDAEVAAAVVALIASRAVEAADTVEPRSTWRDRAAAVHAPLMPGPGAWRASALQR